MTWSSYSTSRWRTRCATQGAGTTVTVSTAQIGETADLVVSDDGSGLPDEDLSNGRSTILARQDDGSGTGLGLAIAAEIAAGHGGAIAWRKPQKAAC